MERILLLGSSQEKVSYISYICIFFFTSYKSTYYENEDTFIPMNDIIIVKNDKKKKKKKSCLL